VTGEIQKVLGWRNASRHVELAAAAAIAAAIAVTAPQAAWGDGLPPALLVQAETGGDELLREFDPPPADDGLLERFDAQPAEPEAPPSDSGSGDLLDQFGESPGASAPPAAAGQPRAAPEGWLPDWAKLHGSFSFNGAYNYAQEAPVPQRGVSRLRPVLRLDLNLDLPGSWEGQVSGIAFHDFAYELRGRDQFTDEVLDQYEQEAELRELFVRGTPVQSLDLKFGRQIVVWGFADLVRVVDILNPVENREPGLADIEDVRLPIAMSRVDYFFGAFSLTAVAVHEIEFNKDPVYGSDFYPLDQPIQEDIPPSNAENTEYGVSVRGIFEGFDVALYWAEYFDDSAHLVWTGAPFQSPLKGLHSRLNLTGAAVNLALGNWLLKAESALVRGLEFANLPGETKNRWDIMAGLDYTGITDATITVEAVNRRIVDFDPVLKQAPDGAAEDLNQYGLSYTEDFWHQTLHLTGVWFFFGERAHQGGVQRYQAAYDVFDAFTATFGFLIFQSAGPDNPLFQRVRNNDRAFFDVKYSF